MTVALAPEILIPAGLGLIVPFLTRFFKDEQIQTGINLILSALIAATTTIPAGLDWKAYLTALLVAWLTTLRADATNIPAALYSKRVTPGKHQKLDPDSPPS